MPANDRILALDRQRSTAHRYRKRHRGTASQERLLAAAVIEARANYRILKARLASPAFAVGSAGDREPSDHRGEP